MVCGVFGRTRQAWYKQQRHVGFEGLHHAILLDCVRELREGIPRIGTRKLLHMLKGPMQEHSIQIGRDKFFDLLGEHGLLVRRRRRRKAVTTDSNHPFYKYPNLVKDMSVSAAEQVWVSDITYIRLVNDFAYLSLVTDVYSRKVVGYCLYPTLERTGPLLAVKMAIGQRTGKGRLIHHSDRGLQYCCTDYTKLMEQNNITISMTAKGNPYENAIAERMNGILKHQFGLAQTFKNYTEAKAAADKAIRIYNDHCPHGSCNYLTPSEAHQKQGLLISKWKQKQLSTPVN